MDWLNLLEAQQKDFIRRLKSSNLLTCSQEGSHSEFIVISGDRLKTLHDFCLDIAEKYRKKSSVKQSIINNLTGKLGEEVIKQCLGSLITEVDYEKRLGGDGKVDFTLSSDPSIGIQVKTRSGPIEGALWSISKEEIERNKVLACVSIQEKVNLAQPEYHLTFAGFLPTSLFQEGEHVQQTSPLVQVGIQNLLYSGGIGWYLSSLNIEPKSNKDEKSIFLQIGSVKYELQESDVNNLKNDLENYLTKPNISFAPSPSAPAPANLFLDNLRCFPERNAQNLVSNNIILDALNSIDFPIQFSSRIKQIVRLIDFEIIDKAGNGSSFEIQDNPHRRRISALILDEESFFLESSLFLEHWQKLLQEIQEEVGTHLPIKVFRIDNINDENQSDLTLENIFESIDEDHNRLKSFDDWFETIKATKPMGTRALYSQQASLIALSSAWLILSFESKPLLKMALDRKKNISDALYEITGTRRKVLIVQLSEINL